MEKVETILGYKGFDKNLKCRDFQYKIGREEKETDARLGHTGFHFCENPMDIFRYYDPSSSRYCMIEAEDVSDEQGNDSMRCCKTIRIGAELDLSGIIEAGINFILEKNNQTNTGNCSAATNTGNCSVATNTGNCSVATVGGFSSVACALGRSGRAKACKGSAIVLSEREETGVLLSIKAAIIDGEVLKADTYYTLINGEFIEVE